MSNFVARANYICWIIQKLTFSGTPSRTPLHQQIYLTSKQTLPGSRTFRQLLWPPGHTLWQSQPLSETIRITFQPPQPVLHRAFLLLDMWQRYCSWSSKKSKRGQGGHKIVHICASDKSWQHSAWSGVNAELGTLLHFQPYPQDASTLQTNPSGSGFQFFFHTCIDGWAHWSMGVALAPSKDSSLVHSESLAFSPSTR